MLLSAPALAQSVSTDEFVKKVAVSDMFEVQSSKLALQKQADADRPARRLDVIFRLAKMRLEGLLESRIAGLFDHVGQCVGDLAFGVIDIAKRVHEQIVRCLDALGEETHGAPLNDGNCLLDHRFGSVAL
jgi:hypothetical protein